MHPLIKGRKELKKSESVRKSECYIFSEVQFSISVKVFVILLTTLFYMVCCVFQATNLVNNYRPRKSARTFVSRLELAINYIRCYHQFFIPLLFHFRLFRPPFFYSISITNKVRQVVLQKSKSNLNIPDMKN